jgi:hypothetical protein
MKPKRTPLLLACAMVAGLAIAACSSREVATPEPRTSSDTKGQRTVVEEEAEPGEKATPDDPGTDPSIGYTMPEPRPVSDFMLRGIDFMVAAQHEDGGWGGGSHTRQNVRDPHAVQTDPGTTAFTAMALMRVGHTPWEGKHQEAVRKAMEFVLAAVENASDAGPRITELRGTQFQSKLGDIVDTSMASQFLSRLLQHEMEAEQRLRIEVALDKCVRKIESSQNKDGGWTTSGWAPVLQSAMNNQALELAELAGREVNQEVLRRSRDYQRGGIDTATGRVRAERATAAAGIDLYAGTAAQRANVRDAANARRIVEDARGQGMLPEGAEVSDETLRELGYDEADAATMAEAYKQNQSLERRLEDPNYLAGFGNNGGEEFISFMMSSETLVISGGETWERWNDRMHELFEKIQNADGSWHGHHCITSPVICTAAAILCLTADRDVHVQLETSPLIKADKD